MYSRSTIILSTLLAIAVPLFAQEEDTLAIQLDAYESDVPDSLVMALLDEFYGKLNPDIERIMADSGAFSSRRLKIGKWIEYRYRSCFYCQYEKVNYELLAKNGENWNISFFKEVGEYKNGNREGTWHSYETERLDHPFNWRYKTKAGYVNNKKEGWENRYRYTKDSTLFEDRRVYYENGWETGPVCGFNSNGDTTFTGQYQMGQAYGVFKFKKDKFNPEDIADACPNAYEIEAIFYHENGVIASHGVFQVLRREGMHKSYDASGKLIWEQMYHQGFLNGESKYYQNGQLISSQTFVADLLEGSNKYYHSNGQLWTELEMKSDKPWTVKSNFDKHGKPKDKGSLKNGKGTIKRYDESGRLVGIDYYENGELVKEENK